MNRISELQTDIHQHLWPEPLLGVLARRRDPPQLVRHRTGWTLRLAGEPATPVDPVDHDADRRAALVRADGLDRALVTPSTPLGLEALPADEAAPLLDAYHAGARELPSPFRAWAAVALAEPDPAGLARQLDDGFVGACVSANALGDAAGIERAADVLDVLEHRGAPLFVHPGPATAGPGTPPWWPALTGYVASMHAAWHAFAVHGRPAHPSLRVCFAMLAGLGPLHRERLVARGGAPANDPLVFLETSSYGPRAIDAVLREVGIDRLVHGSDRPVIAPVEAGLGDAVTLALRVRNPARLLGPRSLAVAA